MLELLLMGVPVEQPKAIDYIQQKPVTVIEAPVEPVEETLQYKIENDINKCEPVYYISAEDASCLPKPPENPSEPIRNASESTVKAVVANTSKATAPSGWYPKYQCTWWVWTKRPVGNWNDATEWKWQAQRDGYNVSNTPVAGAIGWTYGHVVYVESVNGDGTVNISEANYDNAGSIRYKTVSSSQYEYIY